MPACTALVNKTALQESIQLFYNTQNRQLGLALKSSDPENQDTIKTFSKTGDIVGILKNPSQLGSATFLGVNLIVGVTDHFDKETPDTPTGNNICLISPMYRTIATTGADNNSVAICTDDKGKACWIYYLGGTDADNISLHEYRLDSFSATGASGTTRVLSGTSLAAYYDSRSKKRFVVYQDAKKAGFYELNVEDKDADNIQNSADARKGTTTAIVNVSGNVYLYYTDQNYGLRRIVKKDGKWQSSDEVEQAAQVGESSQITAVSAGGVNHILYVADGDEEAGSFTHFIDPQDA